MWKRIVAAMVVLLLPAGASAGPLRDAAEKAGRELAARQQSAEPRGRGRFWTGVGLIAAGAVLATLGSLEIGDDETGADDGEDLDDSDDGEDSDGWGNKALLGGGIATAAAGAVLLLTGRSEAPTRIAFRARGVAVRHTMRF
jgi:hypothetical protein